MEQEELDEELVQVGVPQDEPLEEEFPPVRKFVILVPLSCVHFSITVLC